MQARHLLGFNEPNGRTQANLTPATAMVSGLAGGRQEMSRQQRALLNKLQLFPGKWHAARAEGGEATLQSIIFTCPPAATLTGPPSPPAPCRSAQALWSELEAAAKARGMRLVSPAVSPCGGPGCIDAPYGDALPWIKEFMRLCRRRKPTRCTVDAVAVHYCESCCS